MKHGTDKKPDECKMSSNFKVEGEKRLIEMQIEGWEWKKVWGQSQETKLKNKVKRKVKAKANSKASAVTLPLAGNVKDKNEAKILELSLEWSLHKTHNQSSDNALISSPP